MGTHATNDPGPWTPPNATLEGPGADRLVIRGRIGEESAAIFVDDRTLELERPGKGFFSGKDRRPFDLGAVSTFAVREERDNFRLVTAILFTVVTIVALVGGSGRSALVTLVPALAFFASWRLRPKILIDLRVLALEVVFVAGWSSRDAAHAAARRIGKQEAPPPTAIPIFTYLLQQLAVLRASEEELRARYRAQAGARANSREESRFVRASKRVAVWNVGWMAGLPAALVIAPSIHYLLTQPIHPGSLLVVVIGAPVGFYVLMVVGAILQGKLHGLVRSWLDE